MSEFLPRIVHVPGQVFLPTQGCVGEAATMLLHVEMTHRRLSSRSSQWEELTRCTCLAAASVKSQSEHDAGGMHADDGRTRVVPDDVSP